MPSLTEGTHVDTHLSMEATAKWVFQNPKQLDEGTLSHTGYPNHKVTDTNFLSYPCRQRVSSLSLVAALCSLPLSCCRGGRWGARPSQGYALQMP